MAKKILGVTGCPTGIAHTYMAEEALKKAAEALDCDIKVETNGAVGAENVLTTKDIQEADAIIVACDKTVDMDRFNGKPVIEVSVNEGINKAKLLIQKCLDGKAPIRKGSIRVGEEEGNKVSIAQQIYKHLMNGVSHMLPLVVAGGVLTAFSFLWGIYSFDPTSDQYNQIAATLKEIGGVAMGLMVPVLTAFIAQSIAGRPAMLAGFVSGMLASSTGSGFIGGIAGGFFTGYLVLYLIKVFVKMPRSLEGLKSIFMIPIISVLATGVFMILLGEPCSALNEAMMDFLQSLQSSNSILLGIVIGCMSAFDMGGPVNKAAYVTGTMLLGQGNYLFMAGVSAACITPPLIIAIAATFFKNRFSTEDRTAGLINYILGCTHITEGAIPFAAKNPLKVIPVLMVGSSVSAVLTYLMQIQVPAPHGGFLILGLVNEPLLWVGCILIGSTVGALLYVMITPKIQTKEVQIEQVQMEEGQPDLYDERIVLLNLQSTTKEDVIHELASVLEKQQFLSNKKTFVQELFKREEMVCTAVGNGIAIPHARTDAVKTAKVAIGISKEGVEYGAPDGQKCKIIIMIASRASDGHVHLSALASLSKKFMHEEFVQQILSAHSEREIVALLKA